MASILKVDAMQGVTAAGDITITSEGGAATQSLQQGLAKSLDRILTGRHIALRQLKRKQCTIMDWRYKLTVSNMETLIIWLVTVLQNTHKWTDMAWHFSGGGNDSCN